MYRNVEPKQGCMMTDRKVLFPGERIEQRVDRIVNNGEPIVDTAPIIFMERKEGVKSEFNIRTDRWDIAVEAMGVVAQMKFDDRKVRQEKLDELRKGREGNSQSGDNQGVV